MRGLLERLALCASGRETGNAPFGPVDGFGGRRGLALWLTRRDLAPLGLAALGDADPELATLLSPAAVGAAAANLAHFETLARLERRFEACGVPMVLLKGAAVARSSYADASQRPMTDLDIWVRDDDMDRAAAILEEEGFRHDPGLAHRPVALQRLSGGELVFRPRHGGHGLVELHFSPFQGWWVKRATAPDIEGVWRRTLPMAPARHARRLAPEDAILQTASHLVVNQFAQAPLRGLMDLGVLSRAHAVDWDAVALRAQAWRMATATWLALDIADRLIGLPGARAALDHLRPGSARRRLLAAFVTPGAILAGRDLTHPGRRHPFMLALVDRRRDGARLVGRTLWPEPSWIAARYGRPMSRLGHVRDMVRRGDV